MLERVRLGAQALLMLLVVAFAANLPRTLALPLFTEQFLMAALGLVLLLVFLCFPLRGERPSAFDIACGTASLAACWYVAARYPSLVTELVFRPLDGIIVATVIVLAVLEATRRTIGTVMVLLLLALSAYALFGWMLPGDFATRPVQLSRLVVYLGIDTNALLGVTLAIALTVVVPFVLFGQILDRAGGGAFFTDLSVALLGRARGGPAKIAVAGSALFGTVSGSAVANVVSTGMITIRMMIRGGVRPKTAAAVEAVASTGGQLVPPVMGAAAFLMAEYLQVPYGEVVVSAVIPAFLFYAGLFILVDLKAGRDRLSGIEDGPARRARDVLAAGWIYLLPFVLLFVGLIRFNMPAEYAALLASALLLALAMSVPAGDGRRMSPAQALEAVLSAGRAVLDLVVIAAAAGLLIGVLNLTGLAFGLTNLLLSAAGNSLPALLMMSALIALILGMGVPTVGVYVITATLVAPALVQAGLLPMQAHLFVLYFGMLSMITPPVALAAFAAANIARTDAWETGIEAIKVGWTVFLIPFLFAASPALLMFGSAWDVLLALGTTLGGIWLGSAGFVGFLLRPLRRGERALALAAAALLLLPHQAVPMGVLWNASGVALGALLVLLQARARAA
ncbi:MAG: TRAP transporter fused permease subunit [Acetobacteraceae bacterium]|nr:TRAP transporter fused permease subunit [Acetobacteraceae bacterium]